MGFSFWLFLNPLKQISNITGYGISPWGYPLLLSNVFFAVLFLGSAVYVFSDIPDGGKESMFHYIRLGRIKWGIVQLITIVFLLSNGKMGNKRVGFIIENPAFLPQYSGFQNLVMLYSINNKTDTQVIKKYMSMVGLDPDDTKKVKKYSMGMKQRLAIAQAIMESPQLLILDEPFNGLDKSGIEHIRKLLLELKKTTIVLLASHNKEDINLLCDETFELSEGLLRPVQKESNE